MEAEFDPILYHANQGKMFEIMLDSTRALWNESTDKQRVNYLNILTEHKSAIDGEIIKSLADSSFRHFLKEESIRSSAAKFMFLAQYKENN